MEISRFYLGCLAHASYLVHDNGEAAVIDPQRDVNLYLEEARERGVRIRWVIETHLHADFVSGHLELAHRSGAEICLGAGSGAAFEHRELNDGDELPLGSGSASDPFYARPYRGKRLRGCSGWRAHRPLSLPATLFLLAMLGVPTFRRPGRPSSWLRPFSTAFIRSCSRSPLPWLFTRRMGPDRYADARCRATPVLP